MLYNNIFIDAVNYAYKTFGNFNNETPKCTGAEPIYRDAICAFIRGVESLKKNYLAAEGHIYLLFDNYFSKSDLQTCFQFADRKELNEKYKSTRKKEVRPFYNSLNFIRYYYMIGSPVYGTLRITQLEADDLVKPLMNTVCKPTDKNLLVTSDLDWCKYLDNTVDWLPKLNEEPESRELLSLKLGFSINEVSLILYKAIFGDSSDNIKSLADATTENKLQFKKLLPNFTDPYNIISFTRAASAYPDYPMLKELSSKERDLLINIQLVSTRDCDTNIIKSELRMGTNQKTKYESLRKAVGLDSVAPSIGFGRIKANRA